MSFFSDIGDSIGGAFQGVGDAIHNINIGQIAGQVLSVVPGGSLINDVLQNGWSALSLNNVVANAGSFANVIPGLGAGIQMAQSLLAVVNHSAAQNSNPFTQQPQQSAEAINNVLQSIKSRIDNNEIATINQLITAFSALSIPPPQEFITYLNNKNNQMYQTPQMNQLPQTVSAMDFIKNNLMYILPAVIGVGVGLYFIFRKKSRR